MLSDPLHSLLDELCRAGHLTPPLQVVRLSGGRTNSVWKLADRSTTLVLKRYAEDATNPVFPNDPGAEQACLRHLSGTGLAPQLVSTGASDTGKWVLYSFVDGHTWTTESELVGMHLRKLHAVRKPVGLRTAPNGSAALDRQTRDLLRLCEGADADDLRRASPRAHPVPPVGSVLIHGDPVPGNLVVTNSGMCFIDWQCPAIGDPCDDLAIFLSPAMQQLYRGSPLSDEETDRVLAAYDAPRITLRYQRLRPWFHWRMASYSLWRAQQGDTAYGPGYELERAALSSSDG